MECVAPYLGVVQDTQLEQICAEVTLMDTLEVLL